MTVSRRFRRYFIIPLSLYLLVTGLYLFAIPVGESPDEPGHVQCIEQVSILNQIPITEPKPEGRWFSRETLLSGRMCYHMPLYYLVSGYLQKGVAALTAEPLQKFGFPPNNSDGIKPMFSHGPDGAFWRIQDSTPLLAVRFLSIGLGVVVLLVTYQLALLLFPTREFVAGTAVLFIGGWPQFAYMSRAINNDSLATAVAAVILLIMLSRVGDPRRYGVAAVLAVVAFLTKLTTAFVIGAILGGLLLETLFFKKQWRSYVATLAACLTFWLGAFYLITRHPVLSQHLQQSAAYSLDVPERAQTVAYWFDVAQVTLSSGWARFGWMNIPAPLWHAYLWWAAFGALLVMGTAVVVKKADSAAARWQLLFMLLWLAGVTISFVRINIQVFQPQFRFAWTALPILVVLAACGWDTLIRQSKRWQIVSFVSLYSFLLLYNYWTIHTILGEVYGYG